MGRKLKRLGIGLGATLGALATAGLAAHLYGRYYASGNGPMLPAAAMLHPVDREFAALVEPEPVQVVEAIDPVEEYIEPVQEYIEPVEPVQEYIEPVQEYIKPVAVMDPEPVYEYIDAVEPVEPVYPVEPVEPVNEVFNPLNNPLIENVEYIPVQIEPEPDAKMEPIVPQAYVPVPAAVTVPTASSLTRDRNAFGISMMQKFVSKYKRTDPELADLGRSFLQMVREADRDGVRFDTMAVDFDGRTLPLYDVMAPALEEMRPQLRASHEESYNLGEMTRIKY